MSTEYGMVELFVRLTTKLPVVRYVRLAQKYDKVKNDNDISETKRYDEILKSNTKGMRDLVNKIAVEMEPKVKTIEANCFDDKNLRDMRKGTLRCRLHSGGNPYLKIGPVKQETVSRIPVVEVYHDVLFEKEIDYLINTSKPIVSQHHDVLDSCT